VEKITESEHDKKVDIPWILAVISLFMCLGGGALSISSIGQISAAGFGGFNIQLLVVPILFGFIVIIGALIGLWYQRAGPLLCLCIGLISPLACQGATWQSLVPCISFSPIYLSGIIFIIAGSLVGLIGGILKGRKKKENREL
jgi:hypothetical protein